MGFQRMDNGFLYNMFALFCPVMIPKTVLKSVLWHYLESDMDFCNFCVFDSALVNSGNEKYEK